MENNSIDSLFNNFNFSETASMKMLEMNLFKMFPKGTTLIKEGDFTKYNYFVLMYTVSKK